MLLLLLLLFCYCFVIVLFCFVIVLLLLSLLLSLCCCRCVVVVVVVIVIVRCLKLRMGDLLVQINGQDVLNVSHQDVVTILKSWPKGVVCDFVVRREFISDQAMQPKGQFVTIC